MNDTNLSKNHAVFPPNPYVIGVPLTGDSGFYGRGETFAAVEDALDAEQLNVIVLFGQRRIGKTSLLNQIARRVRITNRLVPVYFDLQGKERLTLSEVLRLLTRTVARAVGMAQTFPESNDGASQFFRETFLPTVANHLGERRLLLLFDEFDVLSDDQQASPDAASLTLFPYLQELILHERQLAFIFVVGRRIEELTTSFHSIFKQAKYQRIGLLTPTEARELITQPTSGVLDYADVAIEAILALTARHPYLTQLMCFEVFNHAKVTNARLVTVEQVHACIDSALESGHGALNWFWDGLPRAERFIMAAIAHVANELGVASHDDIRQILERYRIILTGLELKDAPDRLVEWEILERHGPNDYRFMVELVRIWICKQHPLDSVRRDVDYISRRAVRLFENAREAHAQDELAYAREEYRRALQVNPNHSGAQLGLAQVEYEMGDLDAAIEDFGKAYQIDEMSARDGWVRALLERGGLHRKEGREAQALSDFEAALALSPGNEESRRAVASVFLARGDMALASGAFATAQEEYRLALSRAPERETVERVHREMEAYAERQLASSAFAEALATIAGLQDMLGEDRATAEVIMRTLTRLGEEFLKQNRLSEALEAFQRAADAAPNDTSLRSRLEAVEACKAREVEIDRLLDRALASQVSEDWATAQQSCIDLIKLDCLEWRGRDIARLLVDVRKQDQIGIMKSAYARGKHAFAAKDWGTALSIWESVDTSILSSQFSNFSQEYAYAHKQRDVLKPAPISNVKDRETTTEAEKGTSDKKKSRSKYIWIGSSLLLFLLVAFLLYITHQTPVERLKHSDSSVRAKAAEALGEMGTEGAKFSQVAAMLKDSDSSVRAKAAEALGRWAQKGRSSPPRWRRCSRIAFRSYVPGP